jgi:predicted dehydrogenase
MARSIRPTRRRFIKSAGAVAAATWATGPTLLRAQGGDKLRLAIIGCGGQGRANLKRLAGEHIAALCDVDRNALDQAAAQYPGARKEVDFRRLFDRPTEFDAVVVSTTEHTHAFATLPALQLKKHVYCEKPLAYNVHQTRIMREAAEKAGVATQMGTQVHASDNYRRVVEHIQSGTIGKVTECHVWVARAWGWHASEADATSAKDIVFVQDRPAVVDPVPANIAWDLWLGPAPARPYSNVYLPGPRWYRWWDFGNGTMSDLGSHWIDLPFWALKLHAPATIEASGPPVHPQIAPASMQARYEYQAMGDQPALTLTWYQGANRPDLWKKGDVPQWPSGVLFVGDKGTLISDYSKYMLLVPGDKFAEMARPRVSIPKSVGHHQEWVDACKTGSPTTCPFSYAGWLTEANHLGNVAYRVGKKIEWDAVNMRATNASEAEPFLTRAHSPGWKLA